MPDVVTHVGTDDAAEEIERPLHRKGGLVLCGGEMVDAEHFFTDKLEQENREVRTSFHIFLLTNAPQVADLQAKALAAPTYRSFGFVTFKSLVSTTKARQVGLSRAPLARTVPYVRTRLILCADDSLQGPAPVAG